MNKKGVALKSAFFAIIVVGVIITAVGTMIGEFGTKYNSGLNYDLTEYDNSVSLSSEAQTQQNQITPQDINPGDGNFEAKTFMGGYGIMGRIFLPFKSVFNMLESVEKRFGLPSYVMEAVITMITFALIFSVIAIIFRLGRSAA